MLTKIQTRLLGCYTIPTAKQLLTFWRIVAPSSSGDKHYGNIRIKITEALQICKVSFLQISHHCAHPGWTQFWSQSPGRLTQSIVSSDQCVKSLHNIIHSVKYISLLVYMINSQHHKIFISSKMSKLYIFLFQVLTFYSFKKSIKCSYTSQVMSWQIAIKFVLIISNALWKNL